VEQVHIIVLILPFFVFRDNQIGAVMVETAD